MCLFGILQPVTEDGHLRLERVLLANELGLYLEQRGALRARHLVLVVLELQDLLQVADAGPGRVVVGLQRGVVDVVDIRLGEAGQLAQLLVQHLVGALQLRVFARQLREEHLQLASRLLLAWEPAGATRKFVRFIDQT